MRKTRYQSVIVTFPAADPAGPKTGIRVTLDANYDKCIGVAFTEIKGGKQVAFGINDIGGTVIDETHLVLIESNAATPKDQRFNPIDIPAKGREVVITRSVLIDPIPAGGAAYNVTFLLSK